jgi:hypothetical protein
LRISKELVKVGDVKIERDHYWRNDEKLFRNKVWKLNVSPPPQKNPHVLKDDLQCSTVHRWGLFWDVT